MAKVSFNNKFNFIANKRVLADRLLVQREEQLYIDNGIYFHYNKQIINNTFYSLIVGSSDKDNPYYGGFYLFKGTFPDQYPFHPPKVLAMTQGQDVRFHPNFYVNGKVCLSILGTWMGPPWTSCQNIASVSCSIKSLFIKEPIHQEPNWEKCSPLKSKTYSQIIAYKNLEIAVYDVVKNKVINDEIYKPFQITIEKLFLKLYPTYMNIIESFTYLENKQFVSPIYRIKGIYKISILKKKFKELYTELNNKFNTVIDTTIDTTIDTAIYTNPINKPKTKIHNRQEDINNKKKYKIKNTMNKRKSPNHKASLHENGYVKVSENDNNKWIVRELKSGIKRWFKV